MNLADAIRKAAKSQLGDLPGVEKQDLLPRQPERVAVADKREVKPVKQETRPVETAKETSTEPHTHQIDISGQEPELPTSAVHGGNVVRLELFLNGEQMSAMLKSITAGQHSVLTLREAAAYLRVTPSTLEKLAEEEELPAINIDGRWRFPKTNLDEWLAEKACHSEEEEKNVA